MTDMITVSRKEIEALQKNFTKDGLSGNGDYINLSDLRALLDKAEVVSGDAVLKVSSNGNQLSLTKPNGDYWDMSKHVGEIFYTTPQPSRITELEAEIARLKAITYMLLKSPS